LTGAIILSVAISRRGFIKAGLVGGAALAAAGAYEGWRLRPRAGGSETALGPEGRALFAAVIPAFLQDAIPTSEWSPAVMTAALNGVEVTVQKLAPHARAELRQLFVLLDQAPLRFALAGVWAPWSAVDATRAGQFLERWRFSNTALLASAYQALHDISLSSWYANPARWAGIGYPGPPSLEARLA
jgi:hypothetical protein